MSEHTPGRLRIDDKAALRVVNERDVTVASFGTSSSIRDEWEPNARRMVACWNACEGVPTELLEAYPAPFSALRKAAREAGVAVKVQTGKVGGEWGTSYVITPDLERFAHLIRQQALEELETKVPGGKHTDKWESCRIADYNKGWNDYRKQCAAAIRALKDKT